MLDKPELLKITIAKIKELLGQNPNPHAQIRIRQYYIIRLLADHERLHRELEEEREVSNHVMVVANDAIKESNEQAATIARLREGLRPFGVDQGIPSNWPGQCSLFWDVHESRPDNWHLNYHHEDADAGPKIKDYRLAHQALADEEWEAINRNALTSEELHRVAEYMKSEPETQ